jgi:uncharacterized protein (DUF927 family)
MAAGQRVRIVDVSADAGAGMGMFENLHGFETPDAMARHLREAAQRHYGVAGRAYLKKIVPMIGDLQKQVADIIKGFSKAYVPDGADGQVERVAQRFALIAAGGEIAARAGILPWDVGVAVEAAGKIFEAWIEERGGSAPAEEREGVEAVWPRGEPMKTSGPFTILRASGSSRRLARVGTTTSTPPDGRRCAGASIPVGPLVF